MWLNHRNLSAVIYMVNSQRIIAVIYMANPQRDSCGNLYS